MKKYLIWMLILIAIYAINRIDKEKMVKRYFTYKDMAQEGITDRLAYEAHEKGMDAYNKYMRIDDITTRTNVTKTNKMPWSYSEEERIVLINEASEHFEEAVNREPKNATYHNDFADVLKYQNNFELALKEYEKAYELDGDEIEYYLSIYPIYQDMGRQLETEIYLNKFIKLAKESTNHKHIRVLMQIFYAQQRIEELKEQIEKAKKLPYFLFSDYLELLEVELNKDL